MYNVIDDRVKILDFVNAANDRGACVEGMRWFNIHAYTHNNFGQFAQEMVYNAQFYPLFLLWNMMNFGSEVSQDIRDIWITGMVEDSETITAIRKHHQDIFTTNELHKLGVL